MGQPAVLVDEITERLAPLEADAHLAWWAANLHADDEQAARRARADLALDDALADPEAFAAIGAALADAGAVPQVRRQLEILRDRCRPHQGPAALRRELVERQVRVESTFAAHRGTLDGRPADDHTLRETLRRSDDPDVRRAAWEASKSVGAVVADDVRDLARTRNALARALGARDHFALSLQVSEMSEARLRATLDAVDRRTRPLFVRWKAELDAGIAARFGVGTGELAPWHYDDPFFQEPPLEGPADLDPWFAGRDPVELARRTFAGIGFDVDAILDRSDLDPRPGKNQHAFCLDVDRSGDIRVLANVVDDERWTETMLRELGHGVSFAGIDQAVPWAARTMHGLTTEAVAMLFGRLTRDPEWLVGPGGIDPDEVAGRAAHLDKARRAGLLVLARWVLVMTEFERELYADPDADLDRIWWDLVERFQLVRRPPGRAAPDWAAKIHVTVAPVYYQNYLYGEMVASQVARTLRDEVGGLVDRLTAGAWLDRHLFGPGMLSRWDRLVAGATGAPLTTDAFIADLTPPAGP